MKKGRACKLLKLVLDSEIDLNKNTIEDNQSNNTQNVSTVPSKAENHETLETLKPVSPVPSEAENVWNQYKSFAGQNRNRIVFSFYTYAAKKYGVKITHRFLERGHTQNEADSVHALIERNSKKKKKTKIKVKMPTPDYSADLEMGEPPPELLEYARQHIGEDPNNKLQAIYEFKELIYERGECSPHRIDDDFLIRFLRARNFIPQRAHRLLVNYYQFKEDNPELFELYPLDLQNLGESNVLAVPPYRDQDGRRLMIYRIGCWDPKAIPVNDLFKATILASELGMMEPKNQILGGIAIFDLEDIGTQQAWQITPSVASKIVKMLVSCLPVTTYAIHVINHSWLFDKIFNIFKPLLTTQMRSRIFFHGYDVKSLQKYITKDHLPERYGGTWPDYPYTIWFESLRKNVDIAKAMISCGYKFREEELAADVVRQLKEEGVAIS